MASEASSAHGKSTRRRSPIGASGNSSTSPRALCSAGTRSGSMPARRSASAVAGPTAATRTPASARASRSSPMNRSTALRDVSTTHESSRTAAAAARRAAPPSAGSTWRVSGSSTTVAPTCSRAPTSPRARAPDRVTTTEQPAKGPPGPASAPGDDAPSAATRPTTITAGDPRSTAASPASVVRATRWDPVVAPLDHGRRRLGRPTPADERFGDGGARRHAHEDDESASRPRQRVPVGHALASRLAHPARHDRH